MSERGVLLLWVVIVAGGIGQADVCFYLRSPSYCSLITLFEVPCFMECLGLFLIFLGTI